MERMAARSVSNGGGNVAGSHEKEELFLLLLLLLLLLLVILLLLLLLLLLFPRRRTDQRSKLVSCGNTEKDPIKINSTAVHNSVLLLLLLVRFRLLVALVQLVLVRPWSGKKDENNGDVVVVDDGEDTKKECIVGWLDRYGWLDVGMWCCRAPKLPRDQRVGETTCSKLTSLARCISYYQTK